MFSCLIRSQTQEKDFLRMEKKGKKEKVKEWFTFITIIMDKVYWLKIWLSAAIVYRTTGETGIWVEPLRLNLPY